MSSVAGEPVHTRRFWAKARPYGQPSPEKVHLLEHHLADVGACFEALLAQPTIRRRLARSGGLATLDDETAACLALFAAIHDVGKANVGFQTRVWAADDHPHGRRPGYAGHYRELVPVLLDDDGETGGWFFDQLGWWWEAVDTWDDHDGETVCALLVAALSHHGRPLALEGGLSANPRLWRDYGELRPREQTARIGALLRRWFPAAFDANALALPARPEFQHMFLGLCTLADWIGSNEKWFPFADEPDDDYFFTVARPAAARALREVGLDVAAQRGAFSGALGFDALFDFAPNAIQRAAVDAPLDAPVVILESETGSGKTEAALWRFARMYEKRLVDGIYFALPTRAAASQIHGRVERFVERLFPQGAPPVVLAVPGYDPGADAASVSLQDYDERAAGEHRPESPWAAESPKRYLAAQVAVGTVDQAMMAALKVGHSHLRAACLARNLLVVDEVHASDTYMGRVIEALLDAHTGAGGHALLMSATLGSAARGRWLAAGRARRTDAPPFDEALGAPYPAVGVRQTRDSELRPVDGGQRSKSVELSERRVMADFQAVAVMALDAARRGAKVLVVRNTVGHAVATQRALEERAGAGDASLLFGVNGVRAPHHGRFAAADRALLDGAVEARLGKERRPGGAVVVGTQTLEQSLDIDADLLITDLCPADVLLQRIGRLHRHDRDDRPAAYASPVCVVLTPDVDALSPLLARGEGANGLGPRGGVYEDLRVLEATLRLVRGRGEWRIPDMNRDLVERATHPERLAAIVRELGDEWAVHANDVTGSNIAEGITAGYAIVRRDAPFFSQAGNRDVVFPPDEERIRTRLGDDRIDVAFDPPPPGPFDPASRIDRLAVSARWLQGADVPESVTPTPTDGGFTFAVGERRFVYDRLGLRPLGA